MTTLWLHFNQHDVTQLQQTHHAEMKANKTADNTEH